MEKYIKDVVGHFSGKIQAWDVVNEAIDPNQPDGLRRSLWYDIIGPEYIEYAFKFAHEADPNAKLFYNDYNTYEPKKRVLFTISFLILKQEESLLMVLGCKCI